MIPFRWTTSLFLLAGAALLGAAAGGNPYSSNVVALTPQNWKKEVEDSPHAVFVNICRVGWGYCQQLAPEWERLAAGVKGTVKVAYWDTEQAGGRPRLLGEVKGTPTIRLYKPKAKQGNSNRKKVVLDYNQERKAKDMKKFADYAMPDFVERVKGEDGFAAFEAKAARNGLPRALLFTDKADTKPLTKFLSAEFRRRLLLGQVVSNEKNQAIVDRYGITEFPSLVVVPLPASNEGEGGEGAAEDGDATVVRYEGGSFARAKLEMFLSTHALRKAVEVKKKEKAPAGGGETAGAEEGAPPKEGSPKTEL